MKGRRISWRPLLGFAALAAAGAAALAFRPQAEALVIDPVARVAWFAARSLLMVDQEIYWTGLIFVVLAFGLRLLPTRPAIRRRPAYSPGAGTEDRAEEWDRLIRRAAEDEEGRRALARALQELQDMAAGCAGEDGSAPVMLPAPKMGRLRLPVRRRFNRILQKICGRAAPYDDEIETRVVETLQRLESMIERQNETP